MALANVARERPLTNLLRNPCGIGLIRMACVEQTEIAELRTFFIRLSRMHR